MELLLISPPAYYAPAVVEAAAPEKTVTEVRKQQRQTLQDLLGLLSQTYEDVHFAMRGDLLHGSSVCGRVRVDITQQQEEIRFNIHGTHAGAIGMARDTEDVYAIIRESLQECCTPLESEDPEAAGHDRTIAELNAMMRQWIDEYCR